MESKSAFLEQYHLEECFEKICSMGITWETLEEIYEDYRSKYNSYMTASEEIVKRLYNESPFEVKIVYGRAKDPYHLIEKIIRKIGKEDKASYRIIQKDNYESIVTDLVGIRILTLKKEDWSAVDYHIRNCFSVFIQEPVAYVCYGDRDIFDEKRIRTDYTNKGYRSQHYIVKYNGKKCEIQVRTLAEEVYGEFDHRVRYPYKSNNRFLERYCRIIAKATSELDDLISTCTELTDDNLTILNETFKEDKYVNWQKKLQDAGTLTKPMKIDGSFDGKPQEKGYVTPIQFATKKLLNRK